MVLTDLHSHTNYCDGNNTPEEMVLSAIEKGMECIGLSGHGHTSFDESFCMSVEGQREYIAEVKRLKEKYADQIELRLGVELDSFSDEGFADFDYAIASTH